MYKTHTDGAMDNPGYKGKHTSTPNTLGQALAFCIPHPNAPVPSGVFKGRIDVHGGEVTCGAQITGPKEQGSGNGPAGVAERKHIGGEREDTQAWAYAIASADGSKGEER
ncbi:hypothetical protein FRC08_008581 [Ceratobasidium sp. 394]|nr:hypothetical protein FRC08_008581 [Ceratobasidium sp. 394]